MAPSDKGKYKCAVCGRVLSKPQTCCGAPAAPAGDVHASRPMEPWMCPVCGATADNPMTCCGKRAVRDPRFKG